MGNTLKIFFSFQLKGYALFWGEKITKCWNLKIFLFRTAGPISTKSRHKASLDVLTENLAQIVLGWINSYLFIWRALPFFEWRNNEVSKLHALPKFENLPLQNHWSNFKKEIYVFLNQHYGIIISSANVFMETECKIFHSWSVLFL